MFPYQPSISGYPHLQKPLCGWVGASSTTPRLFPQESVQLLQSLEAGCTWGWSMPVLISWVLGGWNVNAMASWRLVKVIWFQDMHMASLAMPGQSFRLFTADGLVGIYVFLIFACPLQTWRSCRAMRRVYKSWLRHSWLDDAVCVLQSGSLGGKPFHLK